MKTKKWSAERKAKFSRQARRLARKRAKASLKSALNEVESRASQVGEARGIEQGAKAVREQIDYRAREVQLELAKAFTSLANGFINFMQEWRR